MIFAGHGRGRCACVVARGVLVLVGLLAIGAPRADGAVAVIIEDPAGEADGEFGRALVTAGDELAVGAPGARVLGQDRAGLVQLFTSAGVWRRMLQAPTPIADAAFGASVAASDGLLYVGAPGDRPIGLGGVGAVYVFDVATGALTRTIRAPAPNASGVPIGGQPLGPVPSQSTASLPDAAGFGRALAVAGDRVVVGAPDSLVDGVPGAGAVYVFERDGTLVRSLRDLSPVAHARLGASVALVDDVLFAGAPGATALGVGGAGAVRVYDAGTGDPFQGLISPAPAAGAAFGAALAEPAAALVVGAPGDEGLGSRGAGSVYLFPADPTLLPTVIPAPAPVPGASFGRAVIAVGDDLLVGADGAGLARAGMAYLIDPATGVVRATFAPTTARPGERFGFAMAVVGTRIAVGAPDPGARVGAGRVYLFDLGTAPARAGATRRPPPAVPAPLDAICRQAPTPASVDCRLRALARSASAMGLERLAVRLQRARHDLGVAAGAREARRIRVLRRAARAVRAFGRHLGDADVALESRAGLARLAGGVEADLGGLAVTP